MWHIKPPLNVAAVVATSKRVGLVGRRQMSAAFVMKRATLASLTYLSLGRHCIPLTEPALPQVSSKFETNSGKFIGLLTRGGC
jgi:hypothetical protein